VVSPEQQSTEPGAPPSGGWQLHLGSPFGVPVYLSASWLLFLAFVTAQFAPAVARAVPGIGAGRYAVAAAFGVFLGLSILVHEAAHCAVARSLSIPVQRISLSFFSGHSALAREPVKPGHAAAMAVVGPVTNLIIAGAAAVVHGWLPAGGVGVLLAAGLAWSNAAVGLYNLLPGLPLDGGQLLRALIWRIRGNVRDGTLGASWSGRVIALGIGVFALTLLASQAQKAQLPALWAMVVAALMWVSSTSVLRQQAVRDRLPDVSAHALARSAIEVRADLPLAEAVRRAQAAGAHGIVIVDGDGRPEAVANEARVTATPAARRPWVTIGSVSQPVSASSLLDPSLAGEALLARLRAAPASEYVVVGETGAIFGVLAARDVANALAGQQPRRATGGRFVPRQAR
jgi:Zn-dependent protease/CBS domain-containing protein